MITLRLDIEPVAQGRPRFGKGFCYTPSKSRAFKKELQFRLKQAYKGSPLEGPLQVSILFTLTKPRSVKREFPAVKPDIDNFVKAFFDAANLILWLDDAQVVDLHAQKRYGTPGIAFTIFTITGT